MRDASRLTRSCDFQNVYRNGRVVYNKHVVLHVLGRSDQEGNRVGFVVRKKIGSATVRNRTKRLMKEAYWANQEKVRKAHDIVFVAKESLGETSYWEAEGALKRALKKASLWRSQ